MAIAQRAYAPGTASMRDFASRFSRQRSGVRHSFSSGVFLRHQNRSYYAKNSTIQLNTLRAAGFQVSSAPISGKIFNDIGMIRSFSERTKKIEIEIPPLDLLSPSSSLPPPPNMEVNLIEKMKMGQLTSESAFEVHNIESVETQFESTELDEDEVQTPHLPLFRAEAKMKDVLAIPPDEFTRIIKFMSEIFRKQSCDSNCTAQESRSIDAARHEILEKFLENPEFDPSRLTASEAQTLRQAIGQYKAMAEYEEIVATPPDELKKIIICMSEFYKRGMGKLSSESRSMDAMNHETMERFLSYPNFDPNQLTTLERKALLLAVRRYKHHFGESRAESTSLEPNDSGSKQGLTLVQNQASMSEILAHSPSERTRIIAHMAEVFRKRKDDSTYSERQRSYDEKHFEIMKTLLSVSNFDPIDPKSLSESDRISLQIAFHEYIHGEKSCERPTKSASPDPSVFVVQQASLKKVLATPPEELAVIVAHVAEVFKRIKMDDKYSKSQRHYYAKKHKVLNTLMSHSNLDPKSLTESETIALQKACHHYWEYVDKQVSQPTLPKPLSSQENDSNSNKSKFLTWDDILATPADEVKRILTFAIDRRKKKLHNNRLVRRDCSLDDGSIRTLEKELEAFETDPKSFGKKKQLIIEAVLSYQKHASSVGVRYSQQTNSNSGESKYLTVDEILAMPADEVKHALIFAIDQKKTLHNEEIGRQINSTVEGSIKRLENVLHTFEKDPKSLGEQYRATISYAVRIYQEHAKRKDVHENHSGIPHSDKFGNWGNITKQNNDSRVRSATDLIDDYEQRAVELAIEVDQYKQKLLAPRLTKMQRSRIRAEIRVLTKEIEMLPVKSTALNAETHLNPAQQGVTNSESIDNSRTASGVFENGANFSSKSEDDAIELGKSIGVSSDAGVLGESKPFEKDRDESTSSEWSPVMDDLGVRFNNVSLLQLALTRESSCSLPYDHLEFLGDRVLNLVVADLLLKVHPAESEVFLSRLQTQFVSSETLVSVAFKIQLGKHIRMSHDLKGEEGESIDSVLSKSLEALVAAIYLDGGMSSVREFIENNWEI